ncbi:MAG TPA: TolC family outer membrane protein [Rhizomicrobium sp.]|jgi:outer membrane protein|nr:TolC family outer membrane protein [Rhizomicrobium sp.]
MGNFYRTGAARWIFAILAAGAAAPAYADGLMDVVKQAQDSDAEFQAAKYQNQADAEATTQAWSRFLPHVHAGANYEGVNQDIVSSDNTVYAVGSTSYPDYGYDITLDQSLFNYADWANLKAARALVRQSDAQFEAAKQDLLLRAAERYFTVLAATETADAARSEARALKEHLDLVQGKEQGGAARNAELMDAQARYLQSQAKEAQADAEVRDAVAGLRQITGANPTTLNGLSEALKVKPLDPDDPQHWIDLARQNNPRIKAAIDASERGHQQVEIERSGWYPNLSLQLYQNRHRTEGSLFGGGSDIAEAGGMVKLNVPIYEGGETSSKIREADSLYGKARADEDKTDRDVERETEAAMDGIRTATSQVSALAASLHAQEQVVEQLTDAYRSGAASNVDLLDAQRDLFLARAEYVRARYDYALDTLKLRHAVGLLDITDLDEINRLLVGKPVDVADYGARPIAPPPAAPKDSDGDSAQPAKGADAGAEKAAGAVAPAKTESGKTQDSDDAPDKPSLKKQAAAVSLFAPAPGTEHSAAAPVPLVRAAALAAVPAVPASIAVWPTATVKIAAVPAVAPSAQLKPDALIRTADAGPEIAQ